MVVQGYCDEKFAEVAQEFERNFSHRGDVGASFALTVEGQTMIDIWGGFSDRDRTIAWQEDTLVNVYSTGKTMTFLVCLMLADQGRLDLDAPVCTYWPEFGQNGKQQVLVKHLLSHSAGLPGFSRVLQPHELFNWQLTVDDLQAQAPWWEPGTGFGYHALTQGQLLGELVRRITGQSFGEYFKQTVANVLDVDFHIGVSPDNFRRIASLIPATDAPSTDTPQPTPLAMKVLTNVYLPEGITDTEDWRTAEIPAANGHGNAMSVVKAQTALANAGNAFGKTLLSPQAVARAFQEQASGIDKVLLMPLRFGMGYALSNEVMIKGPGSNALWWGGLGGSMVIIDADTHLCMSYTMNQMKNTIVGDERSSSLVSAVYRSLANSKN
ncbi:MAG: CubicO group peptidase (beta-lactamase class C family) [Candidatus Azotimanducaceae bacterium]|jgi:CubicO group peptidase (beta-lactamase class C family)